MNSRQKNIVTRIDHLGSANINDLARQFDVSIETVRRDLRQLEQSGHIKRCHGGAMSLAMDDSGLAFGSRQSENVDQKQRIAMKALGLINRGDVIMLDASSSCWYLAKELPNEELTVITNSVRISFDLVTKPLIKTITIGGEYSEKYGAFLGVVAVEQVSNFQADTFFFSCTGYQEESGAWESNELNASIKKMMKKSCRQSVLLCDSSKEGKTGLVRLCQSSELNHVLY